MRDKKVEMILVGGSAGSFDSFVAMLDALSGRPSCAIVGVFHQMRNVESNIVRVLRSKTGKDYILEAEEKEPIRPGYIYLAPANYHLLIEEDKTFCLDHSEAVNFSRPSIDVTFESASLVYGPTLAGVILSGSNGDGAFGMRCIQQRGGAVFVQDPEEAAFKTMPLASIASLRKPHIATISGLRNFLAEYVS
jgi:two-component system, chemotaxis family, protein-glutamate methylesterase/glutaminase